MKSRLGGIDVLSLVDELSALQRLEKILEELVPEAITFIRAKPQPPTLEQIYKAESFLGKILALSPSVLFVHAEERGDTKALEAMVVVVATLAFRPGGIKIYGKSWQANPPPDEKTP